MDFKIRMPAITGKKRIIIRRIELSSMDRNRKYRDAYVKNGNGEYKYTGEYYRFDMPGEKIREMKWIYAALALSTAILFLIAGFINNEGSKVIYVSLPYVVLLLPIGFMVWDVVKIASLRGDMTKKQYDQSVVQLKNVTTAATVLSFLASAGDIVFMALGFASEYQAKELLFLFLVMLIGVLNIIFISMQKKFICKKVV